MAEIHQIHITSSDDLLRLAAQKPLVFKKFRINLFKGSTTAPSFMFATQFLDTIFRIVKTFYHCTSH